jgi:hypothetical protein
MSSEGKLAERGTQEQFSTPRTPNTTESKLGNAHGVARDTIVRVNTEARAEGHSGPSPPGFHCTSPESHRGRGPLLHRKGNHTRLPAPYLAIDRA